MKKIVFISLMLFMLMMLTSCLGGESNGDEQHDNAVDEVNTAQIATNEDVSTEPITTDENSNGGEVEPQPPTGRIFLYGEIHGSTYTMDRQLEIWGDYYHNHGMRHLFIEAPYFTAQFLNLWMQADDDTILLQLYDDWQGTAAHTPHILVFYRRIKSDFPETIFNGTDVGHQSDTTGQRYLQYLINNGMQETEAYLLTQENIEQFTHFRREGSHAVRTHYMPLNFIREFDSLGNQDVMAINGEAHVLFGDYPGYTNVPTMATALFERYGDALQTFDRTYYELLQKPYREDLITINGIEFVASYFGRDTPMHLDGKNFVREFWRLEDAYEQFKNNPVTGRYMTLDNYPMHVEVGQVLMVEFHNFDGTVDRVFFKSSAYHFNSLHSTPEFIP